MGNVQFEALGAGELHVAVTRAAHAARTRGPIASGPVGRVARKGGAESFCGGTARRSAVPRQVSHRKSFGDGTLP
jgi:hypothetical protein